MLEPDDACDCVNLQASCSKTPTPTAARLVDYSPGDKPWDTHRAQAQGAEGVYRQAAEFEGLAARIRACSGFLGFGWVTDPETGESRLRLREARFCRVRHCPVCQWRRSLMWQARFLEALPDIEAEHAGARWLFLTLTIRNMPLPELRSSVQGMNKAWQRLIKRAEFAGNVVGWVRTTEVTRAKNNDAHPHFHCLLMVRPSYFAKNYVKQERWTDLWRECMRLDYQPMVDVRAVKSQGCDDGLRRAVAETLKYAVKPDDMQDAWLLELTRQVHRLRFIAAGGALKDALRQDDESDADLAAGDGAGEGTDDDAPQLYFDWQRKERCYIKR